MFPTPIQKRPFFNQVSYKILVPLSLAIWLVPLVGIMMTSIRGLGDITAGNLWGAPSEFLFFSNMADVFQNTPMLTYILNSLKCYSYNDWCGCIELYGRVALAAYKFEQIYLCFTFMAANFVPLNFNDTCELDLSNRSL